MKKKKKNYLLTEDEQSRLERARIWKSMVTKVKTSKKIYNRKRIKEEY